MTFLNKSMLTHSLHTRKIDSKTHFKMLINIPWNVPFLGHYLTRGKRMISNSKFSYLFAGSFSTTYKITIGADFAIKSIDWNENTRINLQIWDIAGYERFGCLTSVYYRYA